ncbi:MAG: polyhydroxyalkanoate synthesis repressor PhaR [Pseudomonadota bacterium]
MAVQETPEKDEPITIKKYANRRLYNTATSSYVTLDHLSQMVKDGQNFAVFDAKSGEDITRSVLTQIIFEEESKGQNLLPNEFLRQLIRFYGDSLQSFVPSYLEMSMDTFSRNQEELRKQLGTAFGGTQAFSVFEEQIKQNVALFDRAVKMFTPFSNFYGETPQEPAKSGEQDQDISDLKSQIADLQKRLDDMAKS